MPADRFVDALNDQVANEFAASHQYVAIATFYEAKTMPQLAGFFYRQAVEERGHAMMMIKFLLDTDAPVKLRQVEGSKDGFANIIAPIELALEQERQVSGQISDLFKIARDAGDYLSEQFVQWFLQEQVEEVATMTELLDIANRTVDIPMQIESYIARENPGTAGSDPSAPEAAGG